MKLLQYTAALLLVMLILPFLVLRVGITWLCVEIALMIDKIKKPWIRNYKQN